MCQHCESVSEDVARAQFALTALVLVSTRFVEPSLAVARLESCEDTLAALLLAGATRDGELADRLSGVIAQRLASVGCSEETIAGFFGYPLIEA